MRFLAVAAVVAATALAERVHTNVEGESYVVKLDCVGCLRDESVGVEKQDNMTLDLYIKLSANHQSVSLNNLPIGPLLPPTPPPFPIRAQLGPQTRPNPLLDNKALVSTHDFTAAPLHYDVNLAYAVSILPTQQPERAWVQFDVTGISEYFGGAMMREFSLAAPEQKLVQFLLVRDSPSSTTLRIEDVQLVRRADRVMPLRMKCGRPAVASTSFNPREWDRYGKFGSAARAWNLVWETAKTVVFGPALVVMAVAVGIAVVRVVKRGAERRRCEGEWEGREDEGVDVEAVLLLGDEGFFEDEEKEDEDGKA